MPRSCGLPFIRSTEEAGTSIVAMEMRGGSLAGIELARVCLGDLAEVSIVPGEVGGRSIPLVQVVTDHPVQACLASQYAGWALKDGKFFAMGSGPMRAAAGSEAIYDVIGFRETADAVVGVLETRKPPTPAIVAKIAAACRVEPSRSRCSSHPRPAWPAGSRSWPDRSRRPCTSWPS